MANTKPHKPSVREPLLFDLQLSFDVGQVSDVLQYHINVANSEKGEHSSALKTSGTWAGCYAFQPEDRLKVCINTTDADHTNLQCMLQSITMVSKPINPKGSHLSPFCREEACQTKRFGGDLDQVFNVTAPSGAWELMCFLSVILVEPGEKPETGDTRLFYFDPEVIVGDGTNP